jgi:hypothetical protein
MRRRIALGATVLLAVACDGGVPPPSPGDAGSGHAVAPAPQGFVVFTREALVLDRIGLPVSLPVTVGSGPCDATVASDEPDVVRVLADGRIVGLRNGSARVRTISGPPGSIRVDVAAPESIAIEPQVLRLRPGTSRTFALRDADGRALPASGATWVTTAPDVAIVVDGAAEARERLGTAIVTATYGGRSVQAKVLVQREPGAITVKADRAKLHVGEKVSFEAFADGAPLDARWATNSSVLVRDGGATFVATRPGSSEVCAEFDAGQRPVCALVRVRP